MALNINGLFPGELKPDEVIAGCINIYENVWPNPEKTIQQVEATCSDPTSGAYWQRAETLGDGALQNQRTNDLLSISHLANVSNNKVLQNIHNQFYLMLLASVHSYREKYSIQEGTWFEGYSLLRYQGGQEYKAHYDGTSALARIISAIVYLNDDYTGGEIEFPNFGVKIKPTPGMLILFPSNFAYSHIAHPVTSGTKYALVTWVRDQPV
jgi:hypothetical protein